MDELGTGRSDSMASTDRLCDEATSELQRDNAAVKLCAARVTTAALVGHRLEGLMDAGLG